MTARNLAPWAFHRYYAGAYNVVTDAEGRVITSHVPIGCGPLLAAAPRLLHALARIADVAPAGSDARAIAENAVEEFTERDAIMLADWQPHQPAPRLRIVGVATRTRGKYRSFIR